MAKRKSPKVPKARRTFIQVSRDVSPEEKAAFHQVTGAGRSHVKREFLGLSEPEEDLIAARLAPLIDGVIQRRS